MRLVIFSLRAWQQASIAAWGALPGSPGTILPGFGVGEGFPRSTWTAASWFDRKRRSAWDRPNSRSAPAVTSALVPTGPRHRRGPPRERASHGRGMAHRPADRRQQWPAGRRCPSLFLPRAGHRVPRRPGFPHLRPERFRGPRKALAESCTRSAIDQLVEAGTPVNEADAEWGRLPLHTAAGNGRPASVRRLLAHGADPNLRDPGHNTTPLEESQRENSPGHREAETILRPLTRGDTPEDRA